MKMITCVMHTATDYDTNLTYCPACERDVERGKISKDQKKENDARSHVKFLDKGGRILLEPPTTTNKGEGMKQSLSTKLYSARSCKGGIEECLKDTKDSIEKHGTEMEKLKDDLRKCKKNIEDIEAHVRLHNRRNPKDKISLKEDDND